MKKAFLRALASAALIPILVAGAFADTIYMKNGSVIRGTVIGYTGGEFTVLLNSVSGAAQSRAMLVVDEIDRIEFDAAGQGAQSAPREPATARNNPPPQEPPSTNTYDPDPPTSAPAPAPTKPAATRPAPTNPPPATNASARETEITVLAKNDWTNTQIRVQRGTRIRITGTGNVQLDKSGKRAATPAGIGAPDRDKLIGGKPTGALIAVVGDDNDDFIFVGSQVEFTSNHDGLLFLGINEGDLSDNSGSFRVRVSVEQPRVSATRQP